MAFRSTKERTATMTVAARTALGKNSNNGVKNKAVSAIMTAVMTPAKGVLAPASKLTTEREKPPVTGNPPETAEAILAEPRATSSWLGLMRWRLFAARVLPTDTDSTKPMMVISNADTASSDHKPRSKAGTQREGSP